MILELSSLIYATMLTTLNTWGSFMRQLAAFNWATVVRAVQYCTSSSSTEVQVYTEIYYWQVVLTDMRVCSFRTALVIDLKTITWKSSSNDNVRDCRDSFEKCLYECRHFLHTGNCGVCVSMVWVNLWASVWTDLKQNTDMVHEQSRNHLSLEEDRPRYYV